MVLRTWRFFRPNSAKGFSGKLQSQLSGPLDKAGHEGGKRFGSGMSKSIGGIGPKLFAPLAAAAAAIGIGGFFKDAISGASDLNETATKVTAIFGAGTKSVQRFASQGATALGQTRQQVLDASATFGTFGKAAGLGGKDLAKFSTGFASLSTDMASFSNTSPEEAVQAIGSALRGEAEPMRKYGVLLDDATLRQEALKLGLIKTTKEALTPQQKVLAAQAAIYKQTKDAQGDFARTSGGLANQQRILSAQFTDMKTNLGSALLPIAVKAVSVFNKLFKQIQDGTGPIGAIVQGFTVFFTALSGGEVTTQGFLGAVGDVAYTIREFVGGLTSAGGGASKFMEKLAPVGAYITGTVVPALQSIFAVIRREVVPAFVSFAKAIAPVIAWLVGKLAPIVKVVFTVVATVIRNAFKIIAGIFQLATSLLKGDWRGAWNAIKKILSAAWEIIKAVVAGAFRIVKSVFTTNLAILGKLWGRAWDAIKSAGSRIFGGARDALGRILDSVKRKFDGAVATIGRIWDRLKEKAKAPIRFIVNTVINDGLIGAFNKIAKVVGAHGLDPVGLPAGFARGGYTGPGSKFQPAGIVHADEFVIRRESRRKIEAKAPGLLDHLNKRGALPGYAGGGIVDRLFGSMFGAAGQAKVSNFFSDPTSMLKRVISGLTGGAEAVMDTQVGKIIAQIPARLVKGMVGKLKAAFTSMAGGGGSGDAGLYAGSLLNAGRRFGANPIYPHIDPQGGSAYDFMINIPKGNDLAANLVKYRKNYGVRYVIHNMRIWSDVNWAGRRYTPIRGTGDFRHVGHVHASYGMGGPKYAAGTGYARPGMALVGERGPELVHLRGGERVQPRVSNLGGPQYAVTYTGDVTVTDYEQFKRDENTRLRDFMTMANLAGV